VNYQHKNLAAGHWYQQSFIEQMANIGSEVERALNWQTKHNATYCQRAFERSLELLNLTLEDTKGYPRLKELCRLREALLDYFFGTNQFKLTEQSIRKYFLNFIYAARKHY